MTEDPKHLAIILDGNRRYAKARGLPPWEGHRKGSDNLVELFKWIQDYDIKELTLYTFSLKNFTRDPQEVKFLFKLFVEYFKKFSKTKEIHEKQVRIRFTGRIDMFPNELSSIMRKLMEDTKDYDKYKLNFAMAYDGRAEIVDAVKKIVAKEKVKAEDITNELIQQNLYIPDDVDLLIRTSGEYRISGFLLWQLSYAEFYFTEKTWPEFSKQDLDDAIKEYHKRQRRFGK